MKKRLLLGLASAPAILSQPLLAEQLYDRDKSASLVTDNRALTVGDIVTVVIFESASATNRVGTRTGKDTSLNGNIGVGNINETLSFGLGSGYRGIGETERSDRFAASLAAQVVEVLPNGDFLIEGAQYMLVNGEHRDIEIRGRIRPIDISADNTIISSRLANAEINYDGEGFATRGAKPGILNRIFSFLGL